jgi:NhaP-type Na+/H+ or K+/H+ antiporter
VFWEITVFLLNGLVFVLIGLQLPRWMMALQCGRKNRAAESE